MCMYVRVYVYIYIYIYMNNPIVGQYISASQYIG